MFEKIRSVKQKEEERLRQTFMNFYKEDKQDESNHEEDCLNIELPIDADGNETPD